MSKPKKIWHALHRIGQPLIYIYGTNRQIARFVQEMADRLNVRYHLIEELRMSTTVATDLLFSTERDMLDAEVELYEMGIEVRA